MQILTCQGFHGSKDQLLTELWELNTLGIIEDRDSIQAFFDDAVDLCEIQQRYSGVVMNASAVPERAVNAEAADPVALGTKFYVISSRDTDIPRGRVGLMIETTEAFGSGRHETTQLIVEALEELVTPTTSVLDVGCGSGILTEVARRLGANRVYACDSHLGSVECAKRQFRIDDIFCGSVDAVIEDCADIVIANISAKVIDAISVELARVTKLSGLLLLSGFISERVPISFTPERVMTRNDWLYWLCRPQSLKVQPGTAARRLQPFEERWW